MINFFHFILLFSCYSFAYGDLKSPCEQCEGRGYLLKCDFGYACFKKNDDYSQCLKDCPRCGFECSSIYHPNENCSVALFKEQCGGKDWGGPKNCIDGLNCEVLDQYYSVCLDYRRKFCDECNCINGHCDDNLNQCICIPGWYGSSCNKSIIELGCKILGPITGSIVIIELALLIIMSCFRKKLDSAVRLEPDYITPNERELDILKEEPPRNDHSLSNDSHYD